MPCYKKMWICVKTNANTWWVVLPCQTVFCQYSSRTFRCNYYVHFSLWLALACDWHSVLPSSTRRRASKTQKLMNVICRVFSPESRLTGCGLSRGETFVSATFFSIYLPVSMNSNERSCCFSFGWWWPSASDIILSWGNEWQPNTGLLRSLMDASYVWHQQLRHDKHTLYIH